MLVQFSVSFTCSFQFHSQWAAFPESLATTLEKQLVLRTCSPGADLGRHNYVKPNKVLRNFLVEEAKIPETEKFLQYERLFPHCTSPNRDIAYFLPDRKFHFRQYNSTSHVAMRLCMLNTIMLSGMKGISSKFLGDLWNWATSTFFWCTQQRLDKESQDLCLSPRWNTRIERFMQKA